MSGNKVFLLLKVTFKYNRLQKAGPCRLFGQEGLSNDRPKLSLRKKYTKGYLHSFLQGVFTVQQISDQLLCDREVFWQFGASFDHVWVTSVQELGTIEAVIPPIVCCSRHISNGTSE